MFDKLWRKGVIFKLKQNGISVKLHKFLSEFINGKKQRVN